MYHIEQKNMYVRQRNAFLINIAFKCFYSVP